LKLTVQEKNTKKILQIMNNSIKKNVFDVELFKKLVLDCDLNQKDKDGWTPIGFILFFNEIKKIMFSKEEIVQFLLKADIREIFFNILEYDLKNEFYQKDRLLIRKRIDQKTFIKTLKMISLFENLHNSKSALLNIKQVNNHLQILHLLFYQYQFSITKEVKKIFQDNENILFFLEKKQVLDYLEKSLINKNQKEQFKI
jgi:ankyrin repeat protein